MVVEQMHSPKDRSTTSVASLIFRFFFAVVGQDYTATFKSTNTKNVDAVVRFLL